MKAVTTGLAMLTIVTLAACSSHKTTVQTSTGTATVTTSDDDKNVTIQTKEGTMAIGRNVDAAKLGTPVYPGAQTGQGQSVTSSSSARTTVVANFSTPDEFDKVYEYYKRHMPAGSERMKVSSGNGSMASFHVGDRGSPSEVIVQISSDKPTETDILITHVTNVPGPPATATSPAASVETPSPQTSG